MNDIVIEILSVGCTNTREVLSGHGWASDSSTVSRILICVTWTYCRLDASALVGYWNGMSERHVSDHSSSTLS